MADFVASLLAYLFAENQKQNAMSEKAAERMFRKLRKYIYGKEEKNDGRTETDLAGSESTEE